MSVFCVAFIGKFNEPLYFYSKEETSEYLHLQMIVHSSLDVVEEKKKRALTSNSPFDMYLGQLFPIEDYRAFGCYSNTHNKIIVVCDNLSTDTTTVKETINLLNTAFVNAIQNPFQPAGAPLVSKSLGMTIQQIVQKHNDLVNRRK